MSAYVNPKYATPDVGNPSPWQKALATTMQDTGANQYTGNPWQDYQNPSDNAGWNYTTDPNFNAAKNVKRWDLAQTGAGSEDDQAKAYRLAFDYLRGKYQITSPGSASQDQMREALLYGIQRVKTDLSAPENAGMGGWQSSPWYGYDQYLQGGQAGATQQGGARGGDGQGAGAQIDPNTRLPGSSLPNGGMMYDQGSGISTQGGSTVDPSITANSVGNAGRAAAQAAAQSVAGGTSSPNGGTATTYPNFGQLGNVDPAMAYQAMQQDPGVAAHYLRLAAGQAGPVTSRLGQFRDSLYGRALQAYLALGGVGGNKSGFGGAQDFLSAMNGGDLQGLLNGQAGNAAGSNFSGVDDATTEKILRAAIALKSLGTGTLGSSLMSGNLDNLLYSQEGQDIQGNALGPSSIGGGLGRLAQGGSPYGQALQQFLALR